MSALSCKPCCRLDEIANKSVVDNLIEIQDDYSETNAKSIKWVENLKCISFVSTSRKALYETCVPDKDYNELRNYVAVSYSCEPMEGESATYNNYTISSEDGIERKNKVRNKVISRVCRFAKQVGSSLFWIDQECVDQGNEEEKAMAMDSMDRVYSKSRHPVGLLWTELHEASHVCSLRSLLDGKLVRYSNRDGSLEINPRNSAKVVDVLKLLELLRKDRWWSRAWIFQEEYLGGQRMVLLVRHTPELESIKQRKFTESYHDKSYHDVVKSIRGEMCIPATLFREQATRFLLALREDVDTSHDTLESCDHLLSCFGKYNVLYRHEKASSGRAMSSRIFADLSKRDITQKYDFLPIAANACDYKLRFSSKRMESLSYSVGLCGLAMYLLNGEIIDNDKSNPSLPSETTLSEYLKDISFSAFDPPVGDRELTWLKDCRLSNVKLSEKGMQTTGHLWRVYNTFDIANWQLTPRRASGSASETEHDDFEQDIMYQLAGKLQRAADNGKISQRQLPELLGRYLDTLWVPAGSQEGTPAMKHMSLMASEIVRTICEKQPKYLSLAVLEGPGDEACAIFVGNHEDKSHDSLIFTSWFAGEDDDGRYRTRHVSLKVQAEKTMKKTPPVLRLTEWVNGLAFFNRSNKQEEVIFGWPEAWKKSSKRKRDDEDEDTNV